MPLKWKDVLGPVVAVAAVGVGIWQYRVTAYDDFIKPVREAQLDLYRQASDAAASLAARTKNTAEWNEARDRFLRLYYGPLAIVEDFDHGVASTPNITVELAMIAFKICLDDATCGETDMKNLSLGLAHTARISLGRSWGYNNIGELQGEYQDIIEKYLAKHRTDSQSK